MRAAGGRRRAAVRPPDDPDDAGAATEVALRVLAGAAQTELSLRERLVARGFSTTASRAAVAACAARGYVDEHAYAQSVAERRLARGYGRAAVAAELRARGAGEQPIEEALRTVGVDDEREMALRVARRLWEREERRPDDGRRVQRVAGTLQRRGLQYDAVRYALRQLAAGGAVD